MKIEFKFQPKTITNLSQGHNEELVARIQNEIHN